MSATTTLRSAAFQSPRLRLLAGVILASCVVLFLAGLAWWSGLQAADRRARTIAEGIHQGWSEEQVAAHLGAAPERDSRVRGGTVRQSGHFTQHWRMDGAWIRVDFRWGQVKAVRVEPPGD